MTDSDEKATYDARKARAMSEGTKSVYIVCPLCLKARPVRTRKRGEAVFRIDPNPEVIQVRYAIGGQGSGGFFKSEKECIRLSELKEANLEVYQNLSAEVDKLHVLLHKGGE
jgi:hypothetical protein